MKNAVVNIMWKWRGSWKSLCFFFLLVISADALFIQLKSVQAQSVSSVEFPNQFTQTDTLNGIWRQGDNPAGLYRSGLQNKGLISLNSQFNSGKLKPIRGPESALYNLFSAKGDRDINGWITLGDISLSRNNLKDIEYNNAANLFNENPYQWVDTTGGDWTTNNIRIKGAISSPQILGEFHTGLALEYSVAQGARQNMERPYYIYSKYKVEPGIAWNTTNNLQLGISGFYSASHEDQEMGYYNQQDTFVYLLRGIGTFNQNTFNSAVRDYAGSQAGGGLQAAWTRAKNQAALSVGYSRGSENVTTGISNPDFTGKWDTHTVTFDSALRMNNTHSGSEFSAGGKYTLGEGTDPLFIGKNVELHHTRIHASFEWWNAQSKLSAKYRSRLFAEWTNYKKDDFVSLSAQTLQRFSVNSVFYWNPIPEDLLLNISAGYSHPIQYALDYRTNNQIIERIFIPDEQFLNAKIAELSAGFTWFFMKKSYNVGIRFLGRNMMGFNAKDITTRSKYIFTVMIRI